MGFRVASRSSFAFETDLPAWSLSVHPSGVLHAFRSGAPTPPQGLPGREEHAFAWIAKCEHVEAALRHFERHGFRRDDIVFVPYSAKRNWIDRYPHAAPCLECTEGGEVVAYLNYRPYPNGLGERDAGSHDAPPSAAAAPDGDDSDDDEGAAAGVRGDAVQPKRQRRKHVCVDGTLLNNWERDELHVEIYTYFRWLRRRLNEIDEKHRRKTDKDKADNEKEEERPEFSGRMRKLKSKAREVRRVNLDAIGPMLDAMESTLIVLPGVAHRLEQEEAEETEKEREGSNPGELPFLEEVLVEPLSQLAEARGFTKATKKKRHRGKTPQGLIDFGQFEQMFERFAKYKEEHGTCAVPKDWEPDPDLALWVARIREKRAWMTKNGMEYDEPRPGRPVTARMLTEERIKRLDALGFVWSAGAKHTPWEVKFQVCGRSKLGEGSASAATHFQSLPSFLNGFQELMDYYEENGRWPSQSMGRVGLFVHKQVRLNLLHSCTKQFVTCRQAYARRDEGFMKTRFQRLDEVGFEWTPRGNTRMSWDDGWDMLMEFHRTNGHFNVPRPTSEGGERLDRKSNAVRLYNWVQSLHSMYRSYKLGRKSGSLSEERVMLLLKHGFAFKTLSG
ncbi:hypothetical protein ACHAWF_012992 [Thalassiosira exigua]